MTTHYVDVPEQGEWTDRTLATASWWDKYVIHPGTYPLEFVTIDYRPVREGQRPYYAQARVSATLVERYRVNRLLTASSAHHEDTHEDTHVIVTLYAYQVEPPDTARAHTVLDGLGTVKATEESA
jgi:hypothetical protein